jgi:hypothetical protein
VAVSLSHAVALLRDKIEEVKSTHNLLVLNMGGCPSRKEHGGRNGHDHDRGPHHGSTKVRWLSEQWQLINLKQLHAPQYLHLQYRVNIFGPCLWSSGHSSCLQTQRSGFVS